MAHDSQFATHGAGGAKTLPADLSAPAFVDAWKSRAMIVGGIAMCVALVLIFLANAQDHLGFDHFYRAWALGLMITWGLCIGGLALLMVQYCSGGKWGLLLRRPLEAMSRTLPLIIIYFLGLATGMKRLYLWARYTTPSAIADALSKGLLDKGQAHAIAWKRPMLSPVSVVIQLAVCFALWFLYMLVMNRWSLQRDADSNPNVPFWQKRFENISGFGI